MVSRENVTVGYICADTAALVSCQVSLDRELPRLLSQEQWDNNCSNLGMIGSLHVVLCGSVERDTTDAAVQMMHTFTSIELLIMVSSKAGAVPGDSGQVRVGDVVVPPKIVTWGKDGDTLTIDLPISSGLLATTSSSKETTQPWSLGEDIATLIAKNDRWGRKCGRPDVDELNKIFVRKHQGVSVAHHDGVVISASSYPESADFWCSQGSSFEAPVESL
ncbi:hypothetical protein BX600DRAFT_469807 [Xylariales sp. PMI_506]|nr:hypothetical protein BX600DRAFT_469807 [Xylariales sp. PMI_506]